MLNMLSVSLMLSIVPSGATSVEHVWWHSPQVILDDMDNSVVAKITNAREGSYQPCMADAYGGQYHHDWAENKGSATLSFAFDPPRSGCYRIEEYHPGSNWSCARYLPRNARLEVEFCKGRSRVFQINQAERAAQWNEVGRLPFQEGIPGKLTMRSSSDAQCAESCLWVVDAFRLTWMATRCPEEDLHRQNSPQTQVQESVLTLSAWFGEEAEGDLELTLINHQGVVQEALRAHFGTQSLKVTAIAAMDSNRRLQTSVGSGQNIEIRFSHRGLAGNVPDDGGHLAEALQAALASAGVDIVVKSAVVEWGVVRSSTGDSADADADAESLATVYIISAGVVMLLLVALGWVQCRRIQLQRTKAIEGITAEKTPASDEENPAPRSNDCIGGEGKKAEEMDEVASMSTQPPSEEATAPVEDCVEGKVDVADAQVHPESCSTEESDR
jgi:hypothetical protein